jgi:hypothetical protein
MNVFIQDISSGMKQIAGVLKANRIKFCFIGGCILFKYNYRVTTDGIDILIAKKDRGKFEKLMHVLYEPFPTRSKSVNWTDPAIEGRVLFEGDGAGNDTEGIKYINPDSVMIEDAGIPVLKLEKLIEYKISSGIYGERFKDFADVIELIKRNNLSKKYANSFREDLKNKYIELWHNAGEQIDS